MGSGGPSRILRVPGRLVVNPTDLQLSFPYGGYQVGSIRGFALSAVGTPYVIQSEGLGSPTDITEPPEDYRVAFLLRGADDDAIRRLYASNQSEGGVSHHRSFQVPGTAIPGASALGRSVVLLYVPDNPIDAPALICRNAVAMFADGAEVPFQRAEEFVIPTVVYCLRDSSGRVLEMSRLSDISL